MLVTSLGPGLRTLGVFLVVLLVGSFSGATGFPGEPAARSAAAMVSSVAASLSSAAAMDADVVEKPLVRVIHVPGILGPQPVDRDLADGLLASGAVESVVIFDWVGERVGLPALRGYEENRRQAIRLAGVLRELRREHPDDHIVITAHSGGTGIAVWALEHLTLTSRLAEQLREQGIEIQLVPADTPPSPNASEPDAGDGGHAIDSTSANSAHDDPPREDPDTRSAPARGADDSPGDDSGKTLHIRIGPGELAAPEPVDIAALVLIASALSAEYDLSLALERVTGRAWAINSEGDAVILGAGTRLLGTIDRKPAQSAGRVGFLRPPDADEQQYAKLAEVPYDPAFEELGNAGDHLGPMHPRFVRVVIADLIRAAVGEPLPDTRRLPESRPVRTAKPADDPKR